MVCYQRDLEAVMSTERMNLDEFQRLLWAFSGHRIITVAGRTGMLRLLAEKDATPDDVASELGLDALAAGKVIRALCALGSSNQRARTTAW